MRVLVTGAAGFIGFHLCRRLLRDGHDVTGYDGFTPYYDVGLKRDRARSLGGHERFDMVEAMLEDHPRLIETARRVGPEIIVHLAAQAGVRYSIENPRAYADANLTGSFNVLEAAREVKPRHLLLASTSSVYGANEAMPFRETDAVAHPLTLYAATKTAMEVMSHAYAQLFDLPTTCFRFFTVYGPWGRPDMALFRFVEAILADRPIDVYGEGRMKRDFTYVDDLVEAIVRLCDVVPAAGRPVEVEGGADSLSPVGPHRVVNIAGGEPVELLRFVDTVEQAVGRPALRNLLPMQPGDVRETFADHRLLKALTGYRPATPIEVGVPAFVEWYLRRHRL
ncbi:NAD-dependent epimerase/dehydratase family protein [Lutibaculum baratangense]|uniref:UDP-glucuronic acid epimerase n=1 Tax=Lutibaculum baratangense AMV1 TaxID=631454 RepID=V4RMY5_9HYPH|nr:NAD-dependent epimerase/dehydratase family protein [Lutibaculum baratangense]ESR24585.1 UDP-glucuronic acid epimerase [Lutibaculum baratangense AMV1]